MKLKLKSRKIKVDGLSVQEEWEEEANLFALMSSDRLPCRGFVIPDSSRHARSENMKPAFVK